MSAIDAKQIAVVGAGPGGLTLARLLQMQGADVAVYERDQSRDARVQGSALDLHERTGRLRPRRQYVQKFQRRKAASRSRS